ncbi:MAG: ABC transporter permease [candidate division Zixibacteria bacterium]|nr:ABC transporter permease [candidate division Zixibacteria bacterium]
MKLALYFKQFIHDLKSQKLRAFLTISGLAWGTVTVICLLAVGYGLQRNQEKQMKGMGEDIVIMWASRTSQPYMGYPKGRWFGFKMDDVAYLRENVSEIKYITGEMVRGNVEARYGRRSKLVQVSGVEPDFEKMRNTIPDWGGRFLNDRDLADKRRVVFIGNDLKDEVIGEDTDAVGRPLLLNGVPFTVIGVMKPKQQNSSYSGRDKDKAMIPITTYASIYGDRYLNNIVYMANDLTVHQRARDRVQEVLSQKYKFDPDDTEALAVWDTVEGSRFMLFFVAMRWFVGFVGFMTLMIGGIGLANIMYVVVEERTREVGIKMALGAKKGFVLLGFIFETVLLTIIGGGIGYAIAALFIWVAGKFDIGDIIGTPMLSTADRIIVVAILGLISLLAAYFPARKAANMDPVQALKV